MLIMADRVYVHIGSPKSGTTFLQTLLWANQQNLRASGVLIPGRKKFDHNHVATFARSKVPSSSVLKTWRRIEREIREWPGTAVLSNEWFTMASSEQVHKFIEHLSPAEVHVVFTARNLVNTVPAAWQESLKLGLSTNISDFVASLDTPTASPRWSWETLEPARVLPRWSQWLPAGQIHVVTVPPRSKGSNLLWERFAGVCGIEPASCTAEAASANESVGAESARLLEMIGPQLRKAVDTSQGDWSVPYTWIRNFLSHSVLAPLGGTKIGLDEKSISALRARAESSVKLLQGSGFHIAGDLDELRDGALAGAVLPEEVSDSDVLRIALMVIPPLLGRVRVEAAEVERQAKQIVRLEDELKRLKDDEGLPGFSKARTGPISAAQRPTRSSTIVPTARRLAGSLLRRARIRR